MACYGIIIIQILLVAVQFYVIAMDVVSNNNNYNIDGELSQNPSKQSC